MSHLAIISGFELLFYVSNSSVPICQMRFNDLFCISNLNPLRDFKHGPFKNSVKLTGQLECWRQLWKQ